MRGWLLTGLTMGALSLPCTADAMDLQDRELLAKDLGRWVGTQVGRIQQSKKLRASTNLNAEDVQRQWQSFQDHWTKLITGDRRSSEGEAYRHADNNKELEIAQLHTLRRKLDRLSASGSNGSQIVVFRGDKGIALAVIEGKQVTLHSLALRQFRNERKSATLKGQYNERFARLSEPSRQTITASEDGFLKQVEHLVGDNRAARHVKVAKALGHKLSPGTKIWATYRTPRLLGMKPADTLTQVKLSQPGTEKRLRLDSSHIGRVPGRQGRL